VNWDALSFVTTPGVGQVGDRVLTARVLAHCSCQVRAAPRRDVR
jgi:hypothetical protein